MKQDYEAFVEKFKPEKTTDDCYTPAIVYEAIKDWACKEYGINPNNIVRPFYPGGDYENYDYKDGAVVLDNPPFSILAKIVQFYRDKNIPYFLFAPSLTCISSFVHGANIIFGDNAIVYENGAVVKTAFLTSFGDWAIQSNPELGEVIKRAVNEAKKQTTVQLPKYHYPQEVMMANDFTKMARRGVFFGLKRDEVYFTRGLESQREHKKAMFGAGVLISENALERKIKAEAELKAKAKAKKEEEKEKEQFIWELSDRERKIIKELA